MFFWQSQKNVEKNTKRDNPSIIHNILFYHYYNLLAGQAGVANAGYVQLAHLVMDSQKIGFIKT